MHCRSQLAMPFDQRPTTTEGCTLLVCVSYGLCFSRYLMLKALYLTAGCPGRPKGHGSSTVP